MKKSAAYLFSKTFCVVSEFLFGHTVYKLGGSSNVKFTNKIRYCQDPKLYLNTCEPKNRTGEKLPVFLYIHGGGFVSGAPDYRRAILSNIAARGFFTVGIFYGLAPAYRFPEPVVNIYKALAFLKQNAEKYNIDTENIHTGGESAGGTLALTVGAISVNDGYKDYFTLPEESKDLKFKSIMPICGLFDVRDALDCGYPYIREYLAAYADLPAEILRNDAESLYLSPIRFLDSDLPPTFVITGERDALRFQSFALIEKLKGLGIQYGHYHGQGKSAIHAFPVGQCMKVAKEAIKEALDFITDVKP
ncbi:MAG: alpha/beta hydrolase [Clostridiales bacterium]|jgi:acetyl esterase/lipase|nr:alpha/beta hydrolase [Clostridiales bacterium]